MSLLPCGPESFCSPTPLRRSQVISGPALSQAYGSWFLEPHEIAGRHATVPDWPEPDRVRVNAVLARNLRRRRPTIEFAENPHVLRLRKSDFSSRVSITAGLYARKNSQLPLDRIRPYAPSSTLQRR